MPLTAMPSRGTRWFLRVGLVLGSLAYSGCRPSQNPLIDPDQAVVDERLIGIWVAESTPDSPNGFPQGVPSAPSDGVMVLTIGRPSRDELGLNIPDGVALVLTERGTNGSQGGEVPWNHCR